MLELNPLELRVKIAVALEAMRLRDEELRQSSQPGSLEERRAIADAVHSLTVLKEWNCAHRLQTAKRRTSRKREKYEGTCRHFPASACKRIFADKVLDTRGLSPTPRSWRCCVPGLTRKTACQPSRKSPPLNAPPRDR